MATLLQITPFVLCSNKQASIDFFEGVLGFACTYSDDNYAFLRRDNAAIRLLEVLPERELHDRRSQNHVYIDVDDVDGLYAELKPEFDTLPKGRVRPPFNTEYGRREFHMRDLDALLISFGQNIETE